MEPLQETQTRLADRIWIAVALLHQQLPDRDDFSTEEIRAKLRETGLSAGMKPASLAAHLKQHMVANVPPSSTGYRMMFETTAGNLRLFRPGDETDPRRRSKHLPKREEIPAQFHPLLDWYAAWSAQRPVSGKPNFEDDPLIRLIGSGQHIWADEHADEYVSRLREEPA